MIDEPEGRSGEQEVSDFRQTASAATPDHGLLVEAVLACLPVGVAIVDERGGIVQTNAFYRQIWRGVRPASAISDYVQYRGWWVDTGRLVAPEEWAVSRAVDHGETVTGQIMEIERFDGTRALVHNSAVPIHDAGGTIIGAAIAIQDVTALHESQAALRRTQALLEDAQRIAGVGSWDWDIRSDRLTWSEQTYRMFGQVPGQFVPQIDSLLACVHREDRRRVEQAIESALSDDDPYDLDYRIVLPDSSSRRVYARGEVDRDPSGRPVRMTGTVLDITEHKQAEDALRASEARFRSVLDSCRDVIYRLNLQTGRYEYVSPSAEAVVGFSPEELLARDADAAFEMIHPDDRAAVRAVVARLEETGHAETEYRQRGTSGDDRWLSNRMTLIVDGHGRPLYRDGNIRDITERKAAEKALRKANEQLERRVRERTAELDRRAAQLRALSAELTLSEQRERRRMARLLHDHLQQLLVGAKFRTTILGRHEDPVVKQATRELESLVDEAIQASRDLTTELSPPILHEAGLSAGLEWLASWMADKHGLFVDLGIEAEPVQLSEPVRILLFESVRELLFNAVKHSRARSATVNLRRLSRQLQVVVSDQGKGFDPAAVRPGAEGGGFGLFSIRERLDLVGGTFEMHSVPGAGSRFVLTAPLEESEREPVAVSRPFRIAFADKTTSVGPRSSARIGVLLADDHEVMREGLARLLAEEPDIDVVGEAADGQQAVALAGELVPDVILMDMSMPKLNGIEATRAIHRNHPGIRIIGLSMFEEAERARALYEAGGVSYVTKSGASSELIAAIRASVNGTGTNGPPPSPRTRLSRGAEGAS
ncbi:MAG: PAS domain-containing protein [Candidatus Krumholzibacteriia bacterium]